MRNLLRLVTTLLTLLTAGAPLLPHYSFAEDTELQAEKQVTFYTTYGFQNDAGWLIPLRIWVHEPPDSFRLAVAETMRDKLGERAGVAAIDALQNERFMYRADGFVADSESNEVVVFKFDSDPESESFQIRNSDGQTNTDRNGIIEGTLTLSGSRASALLAAQTSANGWLTFRAVSEDHQGVGRLRLIDSGGLSVISDIDDTIKVTDIPLGETEVILNTFFRAFRAAPCMPEIYRAFDSSVAFHYVSGGPWQLYEPLRSFLPGETAGFPEGSFHMKNVRTNLSEPESYRDIWRLVAGGSKEATFEQKTKQIGALLRNFPQRRFVLIGDSGERDPEVFAAIRSEFPRQVAEIRIRDIVNDRKNRPKRLAGMAIIPSSFEAGSACPEFTSLPRD